MGVAATAAPGLSSGRSLPALATDVYFVRPWPRRPSFDLFDLDFLVARAGASSSVGGSIDAGRISGDPFACIVGVAFEPPQLRVRCRCFADSRGRSLLSSSALAANRVDFNRRERVLSFA